MFERAASPAIGLKHAQAPVIPPLPPEDSAVTIEELKSLQDDLERKLEGPNGMSEMTSLHLPMTMDRRSEWIQAPCSLMKKTSTTRDSRIPNLQ